MLSRSIFILTLLAIFCLFFLPVKDTDFGWHYRCGHEIISGDTSCLYKNTYTYYLDGYKWTFPRFIYDTVISFVYDHFKFTGVSVLGATIMTITFGLVLSIYLGSPAQSVMLIILSILGGWSVYNLGFRSQIVTLFFLSLELFILNKSLNKPKWLWFLPVIFLIWTNTHPGFFLGPLILGLYMVCGNLSVVSILIFIISVFVTLFNPYGWRVYEEIFYHYNVPLNTLIAEWVSPGASQIVLIIGSLILLTILFVKKRIKPGYLFYLTIIFGYMAISARRNLPLFYLLLPIAYLEFIPKFFVKKSTEKIINIILVLFISIACLVSIGNVVKTLEFDTHMETYCRNNLIVLPCQAIGYFQNKTGNVYNTYEWGGFLIWKLPNMKFFVDGRMPAWQTDNHKSPYTVFLEITQAQPGWDKTLKQYNTDYLFIMPGTFLDLALQNKKSLQFGYKEEYRDQIAVIYKKL